jgi:hypothetical protein
MVLSRELGEMSPEKPKRFDPSLLGAMQAPEESSGNTGPEEQYASSGSVSDNQPSPVLESRGPAELSDMGNLSQLGSELAKVLQDEGYHPVILFGTNNSGKTSILMSLFATISSEPILEAGLALCDPILGTRSDVARLLHREAENTFHIKTQAFLAGEKIPKTSTPLPFFIPLEFRPPNGPNVKLAFMESNGEWYRPLISDGSRIGDAEKLYPELRAEIESFISGFQNGITFIYAAPVTQGEVYAASENVHDNKEVGYASLAIKGVLQTYDRIRANGRAQDKHLLLLTKWDALSARSADRAESISAAHDEVMTVCRKRYAQALTAFQGLNIDPSQQNINAFCAGMINERGLLALKHDDPVKGVIASYPVRLWSYLYKNALADAGLEPVSPFKEPPKPSPLVRLFRKLLDWISG